MKAYIGITGAVFAIVTLLHLTRSVELWHRFSTDPWEVVSYTLLTLVAAALAVWAWRLFQSMPRSSSTTPNPKT